MDMTNATSAGPSFGLFDVLFGNVPKEATETEGNEFGSVLKLIKSLEAGSQQSMTNQVVDPDWTAKEIQPLSMTDAHGVMSGENDLMGKQDLLDMQILAMQKEKEVAAKLSADLTAEKVAEIKEKIKQKMPEISDAELNRLVNQDSAKMAQALALLKASVTDKPDLALRADNSKHKDAKLSAPILKNATQADLANMKSVDDAQSSAVLANLSLESKNINQRKADGSHKSEINASNSKLSADAQIISEKALGSQDKWTSTDDFLQLQNAAKNSSKPMNGANLGNLQNAVAAGAAGKQQMGNDAKDENAEKQSLGKNLKLESAKTQIHPGQHFEANLKHSLGIASKDLFLNSSNPSELRSGITTEVVQQVRIQANGGGGEMKLVLHPEGLGEIRMKVGEKNGSVDVQLVASNDEVANMLKNSSKELSEALGDQKLSLAKFDVSVAHDKSVAASGDSKGSNFEQSSQNSNSFAQNWNGDSTSARQDSRHERGAQQAYFDEGMNGLGKVGVKQNIAARSAPTRANSIIDVVA